MSNSPLPIIAVGALGLSSISCVISSLTGFLVSDDSNVESNTSTSNTNTDTSNTSTSNTSTSNTSTSNTSTSNTSTETVYAIPYQIPLEKDDDGWCNEPDVVHQDVPGCGRICSSATNVGSKQEGTWGPWASTTIPCNGAKLDEIWEEQDDGTRKLADGYITSKLPDGISYVWFGYENSNWDRPLNISDIEVYSGGVNIVKDFGDDKVTQSTSYADWTSPKRLFDGNLETMGHTKSGTTNWFKIDLGKGYSVIDKVLVYNRNHITCCRDRWAESFVKLLHANGDVIARSNETLPSDKVEAKNYNENGVLVKTFTFTYS